MELVSNRHSITPNQNHYNHSSVPPGSESSASVYSPELTQQQNHYRSVESTQDGAAHQHFYQQLQSTFPSSTAHINDVENKMAALTTAEPTGTYSHSSSSSNSNSNSITSQSVSDTLQQHQQQQQLYSKTTVPLSLMPRSPHWMLPSHLQLLILILLYQTQASLRLFVKLPDNSPCILTRHLSQLLT